MTIPKPPLVPDDKREHKSPEEAERQQRTPENDPMTGEDMGPETRDEGDARGDDKGDERVRD